LVELAPEQQRQVYDNALTVMAQVHGIGWKKAGLASIGPPDPGATPLEQQLAYLERYAAFSGNGSPSPLIVAAIATLRDSQPAEPEPTVLCWGDSRLANMLVGEDLSIAAAIDWEEASLGSPEMDLGYFLYIMRHYTEGIGVAAPPGFPTPQEAVARYAELTGHTPRHVDFYERLAAVRGALIVARVSNIMISAGFIPPDSDMATNNSTTHLLARLCGLPAPTGTAGEWLAGR
jgi:aminoglycoside phosphotransferase (APT) family kinase protein